MSSEKTQSQPSPVIILRKKKSLTSEPQPAVSSEPSPPPFVRPSDDESFSAPSRFRRTVVPTAPVQRRTPPRDEAFPRSSAPPRSGAAPLRGRPAPKSKHAAPEKKPQPPPTLAPGQLNRRQRDAQAQQELLAQFRARWPQAFPQTWSEIRPLARGVHQELATHFPETKLSLIKQSIARFQRSYDGAYWRAVLKGGPRYNLDGSPNGEVTPEEQEQATQNLATLKARKKSAAQPPQSAETPQTEPDAPAAS